MKTTNNFVLGIGLLGCSEKKSKLGYYNGFGSNGGNEV